MQINLSDHFTRRKLLQFTLPTIIMMIFTSIYGVVDGLFVSNFVGSDPFAAVNLVLPAIMIVGTIGFMFGTGGSAIISMTLGEGYPDRANRYFSMFVYLETGLGVLLTLLGLLILKPVIAALGATEELMPYCLTYGRILLIGMPAFILQNSFQSFIVVAERPRFGLAVTIAAGVTNMVLDFLFVYVFPFGVAGAAWATSISQFVGAGIPLIFFARKNDTTLRLGRPALDGRAVLKACTNGSSEMVTNLSMSLVNILFNWQLMRFAGADGVSAYGIIMYVGFIFVGTYMGYSVGSAPIISYHYGAGHKDELKSLLRKSLQLLGGIAVVMSLLAEILAYALAAIFVGYDPELCTLTTHALRLYSLCYVIDWFNIFASSFFTALNDGLISALISFLRTFLFQIVMVLLLPALWGLDGIWLAVAFAEVLSLAVSAACYLINRKKYGYV